MKVTLDVAEKIGTHPVEYGKANGRDMYSFYTEPMVHNNATPVDGDDYTWDEKPVIPLDNTELTKMIFRLRDLNTALQSENHALRQRIEKIERTLLNWTGEG